MKYFDLKRDFKFKRSKIHKKSRVASGIQPILLHKRIFKRKREEQLLTKEVLCDRNRFFEEASSVVRKTIVLCFGRRRPRNFHSLSLSKQKCLGPG